MAATIRPGQSRSGERIPFYRNVKVIGFLVQLIFLALVLLALLLLYRNISTALGKSRLPADFGFLDDRAGIPIAEAPIRYTPEYPYSRALLVGVLNTLKVSLVGVALTSLLGVLIGVMRLSQNWLLRQIATIYVATLRNTPLAVQIVFWFTAVLSPIPPRILNAAELPGGILFSNKGLAFPWLYPSYRFLAWLPWLLVALAALIILYLVRRRQIFLSDRPGNPWLLPLLAAVVIGAVGYLVAGAGNKLPEGIAVDFNSSRGRGTVFIDANGNGRFDNDESPVPFAATTVRLSEGELTTNTQNITESGRIVHSVFRFPLIEEREVGAVEVTFVNEEDAGGFALRFTRFPTTGMVYQDRNGNGAFDRGEELEEGATTGFGNVELLLTVKDFERAVVADRDGQIRIPAFKSVGFTAQKAREEAGGSSNPFSIFSPMQSGAGGETAELAAEVDLRSSGPLVFSKPSVPVSNYVGGIRLTTSYLALLLALVVYTASFIAEIVRAGIQAVPKGQREAAQALGLSNYHTFSLVVFPQALRIILPPMISQYLNLTKNSSLAPLAAFGELFVVSSIMANQTGASIPMTVILIVSYVLISLVFAVILNLVNERIKLVER